MNIPVDFICAATGSTKENALKFKPHFDLILPRYNISTKERIAGFLSQVGHESAGMSILEENLNYSATALSRLFGRSRISQEDCMKYGRIDGKQKSNPQAIANIIYGGDWGKKNLGNTNPGDGWLYRGRGLKQLTGKDNYNRCGKGIGIDLVAKPDVLLLPENAVMSAAWFWSSNNLNPIADRKDIALLTKRINGGDFGLPNRQKLFDAAMQNSWKP